MGTIQSPRGCCSCLQGVWDICNTIPWAWREYWPWWRSNISCYIVTTTWFCDGSKNHSYYWWKLWCWQLWDVRVQFAVPPTMSISTISDKVVVRIVECGSSDASFFQEI